jgi:hypothetical protein
VSFKQRRPRDLQYYTTASQAAVWLRGLADNIERNDKGALVKVVADIRWYHPNKAEGPTK